MSLIDEVVKGHSDESGTCRHLTSHPMYQFNLRPSCLGKPYNIAKVAVS
jgi:hypothetical protein